jgi:hypothetical protein
MHQAVDQRDKVTAGGREWVDAGLRQKGGKVMAGKDCDSNVQIAAAKLTRQAAEDRQAIR